MTHPIFDFRLFDQDTQNEMYVDSLPEVPSYLPSGCLAVKELCEDVRS
jgi:hypothetical protein